MLSPDQVKPLLRHEDPYVRDAAADYFADSWSTDPEVAPMILEAARQLAPRGTPGGSPPWTASR